MKILRGLTNADIVQQNKDEFLEAFMAKQGSATTSRIEAAKQLAESRPPKDYFLTATDVANTRRGLDKRDFLFDNNPQKSVVMWAQQNDADVLYLQQQQLIEGTPDHAFLTAGKAAVSIQAATTQRSGAVAAPDTAEPAKQSIETAEDDSAPADVALEPAFEGADDDLSRPESISLERDQRPHLASPQGQASGGKAFEFDPANWTHFAIGIMQDCNVEAAIKWGHKRPLQLDSTFACNAQKIPLFTLVVVDDNGKAVPIAFLITSQERADIIQKFLEAVAAKVRLTSLQKKAHYLQEQIELESS